MSTFSHVFMPKKGKEALAMLQISSAFCVISTEKKSLLNEMCMLFCLPHLRLLLETENANF